jgi:riboflavin biosynthesis pyrimidine reductase
MFLGKESKDAVSINAPDSIKTSMKLKMVSQERFKDDIKITYYNINI